MVSATHTSFTADDRSYFSIIKKEIHKLAQECRLPANRINEIDIIVSEITSNFHKHTVGGGELLAGYGKDDQGDYLEIISIDNGPGFRDTDKMIADGYSSSSTLGHGLGSIKRLSDTFDVYSQVGWGTILLSRIYKEPLPAFVAKNTVDCKGLVVAKPGEAVSGDGYCFYPTTTGFKIMIADGLGHGVHANQAVNEAIQAFKDCAEETVSNTIRYIHQAIRNTRGVVASLTFYNAENRTWSAAGVGNIATKWVGGQNIRNHLSYNGIIGHNIPNTINDIHLSQNDFKQFIACSDGIRSRWDASKYPLIHRHDSMILAAAIYKDYARRTDDMSVIICKTI